MRRTRKAKKFNRSFKKRYTKGCKRTRTRGRARTSTALSPIGISWKNPLPQKAYYKFTYQDSRFGISTVLAGNYRAGIVFRGNSAYDPDYTGVGVQPYGWDNMCGANAPFGRYVVYASKITVYPHPYTATTGTAGNYSVRYTVFPLYSNTATYDEFEDLARIPYSKRRVIESANDTKNILTCYASTKKMIPDAGDLSGGYYSAGYNANPPLEWFWHIRQDSTEFQNDVTVYYDVKITYYCKLMKVDDVNES